jgi:hypothetical protein
MGITVMAAGGGSWIAAAEASASRPAGGRAIVVRAQSDKTVNVAVAGDSTGTGNEVVFSETLWVGSTQVGSDSGVCTQTPDPDGAHYTCDVAFVLDGRGQITVQGLVNFADADPVLAITGGTGQFRGAKGEFDFTTQSPTSFTDTFHLVD